MKKLFIYIIIIGLLFSCKDNNISSNNTLDANTSGLTTQTFLHDGLMREYVLYIPSTYDGSESVPLFFNFHGFGGDDMEYFNHTNMQPLADANNFILIYPQGSLLNGTSSHWNSSALGSDNKSNTDDIGFIENLITTLTSTLNIDNKRIYVFGYSNGGFFSYYFACNRNNLVAVVGSVSSSMQDDALSNCNPSHPTPLIIINGTADTAVLYNGGNGLISISGAINYWVNYNNTNTTPMVSRINNVERYLYTGGDNNTSIVHYKIINGGHDRFIVNYEGNNTGELIWNFSSRYNTDGLIP